MNRRAATLSGLSILLIGLIGLMGLVGCSSALDVSGSFDRSEVPEQFVAVSGFFDLDPNPPMSATLLFWNQPDACASRFKTYAGPLPLLNVELTLLSSSFQVPQTFPIEQADATEGQATGSWAFEGTTDTAHYDEPFIGGSVTLTEVSESTLTGEVDLEASDGGLVKGSFQLARCQTLPP
jgi:hypothetical protein